MSDYTEGGAVPVEDAAIPDPPTVDEVLAERDAKDRDRHDAEAEPQAEAKDEDEDE